jgi:hypothetical protein
MLSIIKGREQTEGDFEKGTEQNIGIQGRNRPPLCSVV